MQKSKSRSREKEQRPSKRRHFTDCQIPRQQNIQQIAIVVRKQIFDDDEPIDYKQLVKTDELRHKLKDQADIDYDLETNLHINLKARFTETMMNPDVKQLPSVLNIRTEPMAKDAKRAPFDLVCVLDHSGSMGSKKIKLLKETLKFLLEQLDEKDRICLIQYNHSSQRMCPLIRNTQQNNARLLSLIDSLSSNGGTNITSGMQMALHVLGERKYQNAITSIFLLTDGLDDGAITGTKNALHNAAITDPFTINCFGFGADHDGNIMTSISKMKDGNFFYIDKLEIIDEAFAIALGGLMSVVAQDIEIHLLNTCDGEFKDLHVRKTYGLNWEKVGVTNGIKLNLVHLIAGKEKGLVFDLNMPYVNIEKEVNVLALEATLNCKDHKGEKVKKHAQLHILFHPEGSGKESVEDGEVMENYFRVIGAEAINEAMRLADQGMFQEGQTKLNQLMEGIQKNKVLDKKKMSGLVTQIKESKEYCSQLVYKQKKNTIMGTVFSMSHQGTVINRVETMNQQEYMMSSRRRQQKMEP